MEAGMGEAAGEERLTAKKKASFPCQEMRKVSSSHQVISQHGWLSNSHLTWIKIFGRAQLFLEAILTPLPHAVERLPTGNGKKRGKSSTTLCSQACVLHSLILMGSLTEYSPESSKLCEKYIYFGLRKKGENKLEGDIVKITLLLLSIKIRSNK